jgi:hypothetical protein
VEPRAFDRRINEARAEYARGNIDVFELERRVASLLEHEPTDKIRITHVQSEESPMEAVRKAGGIAALSAAIMIALVTTLIVALAIAALILQALSG